MHTPKEVNNITIIGRRWFQKTHGNTYHSVEVFVNGEKIGRVPYAYGYGDQYKQTAHKILQDASIYYKTGERKNGMDMDYYDFLQDIRVHRDKFVISVSDVARKKDL